MVTETKRVLKSYTCTCMLDFSLDIPPEFQILSSTCANDWFETLKDNKHCDVTCLLQGQEFDAHQVILCSASGFFCRLFQTGKVSNSIVQFLNNAFALTLNHSLILWLSKSRGRSSVKFFASLTFKFMEK